MEKDPIKASDGDPRHSCRKWFSFFDFLECSNEWNGDHVKDYSLTYKKETYNYFSQLRDII